MVIRVHSDPTGLMAPQSVSSSGARRRVEQGPLGDVTPETRMGSALARRALQSASRSHPASGSLLNVAPIPVRGGQSKHDWPRTNHPRSEDCGANSARRVAADASPGGWIRARRSTDSGLETPSLHAGMNVFKPSRCCTVPGRPRLSRSCRSSNTARSAGGLAIKRSPVAFSRPTMTPNSGPFLPCMTV